MNMIEFSNLKTGDEFRFTKSKHIYKVIKKTDFKYSVKIECEVVKTTTVIIPLKLLFVCSPFLRIVLLN